jgi:hypothetical protein
MQSLLCVVCIYLIHVRLYREHLMLSRVRVGISAAPKEATAMHSDISKPPEHREYIRSID